MGAAPVQHIGDCYTAVRDVLWRRPAVLGRLLFFADRFNVAARRYFDVKLAGSFGDEAVHNVLTELHEETFTLWEAYNQSKRLKDLCVYLRVTRTTPQKAVNAIINSPLQLVPAGLKDGGAFKRELAALLLLASIELDGPRAGR